MPFNYTRRSKAWQLEQTGVPWLISKSRPCIKTLGHTIKSVPMGEASGELPTSTAKSHLDTWVWSEVDIGIGADSGRGQHDLNIKLETASGIMPVPG